MTLHVAIFDVFRFQLGCAPLCTRENERGRERKRVTGLRERGLREREKAVERERERERENERESEREREKDDSICATLCSVVQRRCAVIEAAKKTPCPRTLP